MRTKSTRGPWSWDGCVLRGQNGGGEVVVNDSHVAEPDKRLIGAAPELLEAVEMALKHFDEAIRGRRPSVPPLKFAGTLRAAIAKARGES